MQPFFHSIVTIIACAMCGLCTLVIGVRNPIHSILLLIMVFLLGSILLFFLPMEYFAILFTVVYVGAIVVLFLFIVMMLEIKIVNFSERFNDLFSYRRIILGFLLVELLLLFTYDLFDFAHFSFLYTEMISSSSETFVPVEGNILVNFSELLQRTDSLRALGGILFTQYGTSVLIAALLLFLSMAASIVLTLDNQERKTIKEQDANLQGLRTGTTRTRNVN